MSYEVLIKRTVYVAECKKCGMRDVRTDNSPRERQCECREWHPFIEESYVGPDLKKEK